MAPPAQQATALFTLVPPCPGQQPDPQVLQLKDVDLNIQANGEKHQTSLYSVMSQKQDRTQQQLVVRRGQEFTLDLEFDRAYVKGNDSVKLIFGLQLQSLACEKKPKKSHVSFDPSIVPVPVNDEKPTDNPNGWLAYIVSVNGTKITVNVKPPSKSPVGKWNLQVELATQKNPASVKYALSRPLYIIFNPWCPEDDTYYSDKPEHLNEYVLGTTGMVYNGYEGETPLGKNWNYGQFAPDVLDCAIHLMGHFCKNEMQFSVPERGDVVKVVRRLTSVINSDAEEDDGVLLGRWSNEAGAYDDGKRPSFWNGSKEILQQYYRAKQSNPNKNAAVRYGQCWVFASVLTSVCRALGIPSRPVTNFQSGHEKKTRGYSFAIDKYYDAVTKKKVHAKDGDDGYDSIWDFHVWCEAWMKRADVGEIYNGWQVIDATAQETSEDEVVDAKTHKVTKVQVYTMGPAPVAACRRGDVDVKYDVDFLFGEVNSDVIRWYTVGEEHYNFESIQNQRCIGQRLSTHHAEHRNERHDVTNCYKPEEGTEEARRVKRNALERAHLDISRLNINEDPEVSLHAVLPKKAFIGQPFQFQVVVENKNASKKYAGTGWVQVYTAQSSNNKSDLIEEFQLEFDVGPKSKQPHSYTVAYEKYKDLLKDFDRTLLIQYSVSVTNENISSFGESYYCFSRPELQIEVPKKVKEAEKFKANVKFENKLPITIQDGYFKIQADGCGRSHKKQQLASPLKPGETATVAFELEPYMNMYGKANVIAVDFFSPSTWVTAHGTTEIHVYK